MLCITACSSTPTREPGIPGVKSATPHVTDGLSWKTCYGKMKLDQTGNPDWSIDLFLAHSVFGPVLNELGDQLPRWRFHRRAAPDQSGHRFSFMFYSDMDTAISINSILEKNLLLRSALAENILELFYCNSPDDVSLPGIADTSDPSWSETLQRSWPAYIMGVSNLWLGLVDEAVGEIGPEESLSAVLEKYQQANESVTRLWQSEGQHALLHHLNAIFGYQPLIINKALTF